MVAPVVRSLGARCRGGDGPAHGEEPGLDGRSRPAAAVCAHGRDGDDGAMSGVAVRVLPGPFEVGEIDGLLPERDASDADKGAELRAALARYGVVCVRLPTRL